MQSAGSFRILPGFRQVLQQIRCYGKHNKKFLYKDGVKFGQLFYYPRYNRWKLQYIWGYVYNLLFPTFRTENHVEPPVEPAKLFRVERIKPYKGCPYWEKRILRDLGLGEDVSIKSERIFLRSPFLKRVIVPLRSVPNERSPSLRTSRRTTLACGKSSIWSRLRQSHFPSESQLPRMSATRN